MINLNEITWYSRLVAILFFLLIFPALSFYLGKEYGKLDKQFSFLELRTGTSNVLTENHDKKSDSTLTITDLKDGTYPLIFINGQCGEKGFVSGLLAELPPAEEGMPMPTRPQLKDPWQRVTIGMNPNSELVSVYETGAPEDFPCDAIGHKFHNTFKSGTTVRIVVENNRVAKLEEWWFQ